MRRRRRKRWTWFPILGAADPNVEGTDDFDGRVFSVPVDGSGATNAIVFPLIPDVQTDPDRETAETNAQLMLALSTDYEIERIVGKCFVAVSGPADDPPTTIAPKVVQVGVGLFVAKQADDQAGGGPDIPLGSASLPELLENYNPCSNDTARSPWMWKRDWLLSTQRPSPAAAGDAFGVIQNAGISVAVPSAFASLPASNVYCGSVMDGPHVDSKVNRRVRSDSRLWCIAAARSLDRILNNQNPTTNVLIDMKGLIAIRVLGALRAPKKTGSFT